MFRRETGLPIYYYAVTLSALSIIAGLRWDASWHATIGRDNFYSPPHILVYLGAILGGVSAGTSVIRNSFFTRGPERGGLIRIWGLFYASLGSLFCIWGALAMLASAPFDDWWHSAYGLDIVIVSPPHTVLGLGMLAIQVGACISISTRLNEAESGPEYEVAIRQRKLLRGLFIITVASLLSMMTLWVMDYIDKRFQRSALFYEIIAVDILLFLPAFGRALRMKWGMTLIMTAYFLFTAVTSWIIQLFPAVPRLGPILNPVTHMQPLPFPLLLFIPAFFMDRVMQRPPAAGWKKAAGLSAVFILAVLAVQYPFSGFLLESPAARNAFFGSGAWGYNLPPGWEYRYRFQDIELSPVPELVAGLSVALLLGFFSAWISLRWGTWFTRLRR